VIDASSGGVFIDGAEAALGTGNELKLEHQMRLRLGDFVIRVEMQDQAAEPVAPTPAKAQNDSPFDFGAPDPKANEPKIRPDSLPDPFGLKPGADPSAKTSDAAKKPPRPLDQADPFELDLVKSDPKSAPDHETASKSSSGGYFDTPSASETPDAAPQQEPSPPIEVTMAPARPPKEPAMPKSTPSGADQDMIAALFKGLGLDAEIAKATTPEEMEAIGARFRDLVDGLMYLLRTRAQEKQKIRAAQTIIANADVNPLKFLANSDEAILALIRGRDQSYLSGDKAIPAAYRDLADHQVRTWQALQTALRRMIDRFDPEEVERDMADTGLLEQIVAGGRSAKMWQLYQERYRDIAEAAEKRFLGEVGADFRDAYENERK
jgi:type VI secretion system protein ImpI